MVACTDRLDALLKHFPISARLFHSGMLCGVNDFATPGEGGQIHLIKSGTLEVWQAGQPPLIIREPSLLFYPRPLARRFVSDAEHGADLVCAELGFDGGSDNPLVGALPPVICLPLASIIGIAPVLAFLFDEAFSSNCGRHALVNRLFEVVLIQLLRHLMETDQIRGGLLAGLSHTKLRRAIIAMHEQPQINWSLDALAELTGMSRSVFASTFRTIVGTTAGGYLQSWRVRLAQQALRQGQSLKMIAVNIGYGSEAALSRAFKAQCGMTPREWRQVQSAG